MLRMRTCHCIGPPVPIIRAGPVTTGNQWKFLSLKGNTAYIDLKDYYIDQVDSIMGILVGLVQPPMQVVMA